MTTKFHFYFLRHPTTREIRYVGKTVNPKQRLRHHIYEAKKNNHNKRERWVYQIVKTGQSPILDVFHTEDFDDRSLADQFEHMLIRKCKKRFRLTNGVDRGFGGKVSTRAVHQYCRDTRVFLKTYLNSFQAELETGIRDCNISRCCKNEQGYGSKSAGGFLWSFEKMEYYPRVYMRGFNTKPVAFLGSDGTAFIFPSGRIAAEAMDDCRKAISACIRGSQKTSLGRRWVEVTQTTD